MKALFNRFMMNVLFMHPEERELFRKTFCIENQMAVYERGEKYLPVVVRQLGDDNMIFFLNILSKRNIIVK